MSRQSRVALDHLPLARERGPLVLALGMAAIGVAVLSFVLAGGWRTLVPAPTPAPPPVVVVAPTPTPGSGQAPVAGAASIVAQPPPAGSSAALVSLRNQGRGTHIRAAWEAGFYPLYETAAQTFGVNWLLLASIHKQESAFSTNPTTYHGLNFAGCCGGPMQFNVTNRPVSTWQLVSDSYRYAVRPVGYNHATTAHPSIYDDFDSIMAAGRLLAADGAASALDGTAWQAAYDYYGHDANGVAYADEVLARAISWSQRGFCINCASDPAMVAAVHAAYGAPALAQLAPVSTSAPARSRARPARRSRTRRSR